MMFNSKAANVLGHNLNNMRLLSQSSMLYPSQVRFFAQSLPPHDKQRADRINKLPLKEYFEELMRRRPTSKNGYINLPQSNFVNMTEKAKTPEEFETLKYAFVQYTGHRNILPHAMVDNLLIRALKHGQAVQMHEFLKFHAELLYHPAPQVVNAYFNHACAKNDYEALKEFFNAIKGRYMMKRHVRIHNKIICEAHANADKETVIECYLDLLSYAGISEAALTAVAESMSYEECIDNVLFGHLKDRMDEKKVDSRLYAAVYYFNTNGGLTAADLLNSLAKDGEMPKSELFKEQLMDKVNDQEFEIDSEVRDALRDAIKNLEPKMDAEFYGLEQEQPEEEVAEEVVEGDQEESQEQKSE